MGKCSIAGPSNESETVSVRQISNGYIVTKSSYGGKNGYKSEDTFCPTKPKLVADAATGKRTARTSGKSPLAGARKTLKSLVLLGALLVAPAALGQTVTKTQPLPTTSTDASGTVAVTDTFQSVFTAAAKTVTRTGCFVQNNSAAAKMWVFFGPIASATKGKSVVLAAGTSTTCERSGGSVLYDQVSITGTATDAFTASQY